MTLPPNGKDDKREFDYVIVGAGASAMGLVHGLLSRLKEESPGFSIAVLERGPPHARNTTSPNRWCDASHKQSASVQLLDSHIGNRVVDIPVGTGLGGTTNINACLCIAPSSNDFSSWPTPWNELMLDSVGLIQHEMIENNALCVHRPGDDSFCCCSSTLYDSKACQCSEQERASASFDSNVPLSVAQKENGTFVRKNYYESLVEPILQSCPHLSDSVTFILGFEVQRLLFDENDVRVIGVDGGPRNQAIYARREVILCAGAIESPALLLVSGIGHEQDLKQARIHPKRKRSCAGVGRGLRDHVLVPFVFLSHWAPRMLSPNGIHALRYHRDKDGNQFQFILNDSAVYSQLVPHFVASFVRRRVSGCKAVNFILHRLFLILRLLLTLLVSYTPIYFVLRYLTITINVALMNPKSSGAVSIRRQERSSQSSGPLRRADVNVLVHAGYLSDQKDIEALLEGFTVASQRFEKLLGNSFEVLPGPLFGGTSASLRRKPPCRIWFGSFVSHFGLPYFHWCASCAMKTKEKPDWVVDSSLRVRDIPGLRVCDASVFPSAISAPTALSCAALGHAFAHLLLNSIDKKEI